MDVYTEEEEEGDEGVIEEDTVPVRGRREKKLHLRGTNATFVQRKTV